MIFMFLEHILLVILLVGVKYISGSMLELGIFLFCGRQKSKFCSCANNISIQVFTGNL
jgi:hypothetical protein